MYVCMYRFDPVRHVHVKVSDFFHSANASKLLQPM